jgi:cystathionine beta-lyase
LRRRTSAKWREYPEDVLPLWIAEMDVEIADPVIEAVTAAMSAGDTGYSHGTTYAEALAEFARDRWHWHIDIKNTALVPDVMLGIVEILKLVTDRGSSVVINPPVYPPFYQFIEHMDRKVIEAPLGDDHRIVMEALEQAFSVATGQGVAAAYLLCNPQNPTGTVHTRDELAAAAALANRYAVRVIANEAHAPLVYPGSRFVPYLTVEGADTAFSVTSAAKAWNLSGLKSAVVTAAPGARTELATMPEEVADEPSHLGVIAHSAALRAGGEWLDALLTGLDRNRLLLRDLLTEHVPSIGYEPPEATYFAWLDCAPLALGNDPARAFLERGRVAFNPGPSFGTGGEGHARLNFATSTEIIEEAVARMVAALVQR